MRLPEPVRRTPKPLTDLQFAEMVRNQELVEAFKREMRITGNQKSIVNRISSEEKQRHVEAFCDGARIAEYPKIDSDVAEENALRWLIWNEKEEQDHIGMKSIEDALAEEIERAHLMVDDQPPPASARLMSSNLLASDLAGKIGTLGDIQSRDVSLDLVLAHLEALGYELAPRLSISIARRALLLLINRGKFK